MFETEIDVGPSLLAVLFQTFFVAFFSVVFGFMTFWLPGMLRDVRYPVTAILEAFCILATAAGVPYLLARLIGESHPGLVSSGKAVGIAPAIVLVPLTIVTGGRIFTPPTQGPEAIAWLGMLLFVYPSLGCIGYSLGMLSMPKRQS